MKNNIAIAVLCVVAAFTLHLVINSFIPFAITFDQLMGMHLVLGILILLIVVLLNVVQKQLSDKLGMAFLAAVTFKMLLSATYVLLFYKGIDNMKVLVVHFFGLYMFYLIAEVVFALQILLKPSK